MAILIGLVISVVVGIIEIVIGSHLCWSWLECMGMVTVIVFGVCFIFGLLSIPMQRMDTMAGIAKFKSVQETVNVARTNERDLELAAIQQKVAEVNQWLSEMQYYNKTTFSFWIPDEIDSLKPIR